MMNARIYIRIFMAILFLGMMPSCTYETIHVGGLDENANVTLTLALGDQAVQVSRATVEDVEPENSISTVDLFFYKANDGESVAPVHVEKEITSISNGTISFSMPTDKFEELFPNNETTTCQVFAIVNRPAVNGTYNVLPADAEATVANLKNMELKTDFASQTSFVMQSYNKDAEGNEIVGSSGMVTINRTQTNGLNGTIPVKRVAAKIGFELMFPTNVDEALQNKLIVKNGDAIEWIASPSDVEVKLYFGSSRTKLGSTTNGELFNVDYTTYTDNLSFYTYPTNWGNDESAHTHLMVKVTWTKYGDNSDTPETTTKYYEISNLNPGFEYIEQNHYYIIQQSISILGADSEDEAVELTPCYNVLDWGAAGLSGVLNRNRYLAVDETNVIMNNIVTKRIKFASSDPIDLTEVDVFWDYTRNAYIDVLPLATEDNATPTVGSINTTTKNVTYIIENVDDVKNVDNRIIDKNTVEVGQSGYDPQKDYTVHITINNTENYIEVSHNLDNSIQEGSDFTKYTINLKVAHVVEESEAEGLTEKISITQYPMLSIEPKTNFDYTDDDSNKAGDINEYKGYVYINSQTQSGSGTYGVGGWPTMEISQNPNKYIVTVSSLANVDTYIIGDPRAASPSTTITNKGSYYPTDREADEKLIAPQFMVASSYGYCPSTINSLDEAEQRCATYQEDGYPAGRWRVPTQAEVQYMIQLSEWKVIPQLFSDNTWYWSAQGGVRWYKPNSGEPHIQYSDNPSQPRVRCVYDIWRWGDVQVDRTIYTYVGGVK